MKLKNRLMKVGGVLVGVAAMATPAMAADYTVPTIDLTNFYALGTLLLAAGAGVFIFRKVRKLLGF